MAVPPQERKSKEQQEAEEASRRAQYAHVIRAHPELASSATNLAWEVQVEQRLALGQTKKEIAQHPLPWEQVLNADQMFSVLCLQDRAEHFGGKGATPAPRPNSPMRRLLARIRH